MNDENGRESNWKLIAGLGVALAIAGAIWLFVLISAAANPSVEVAEADRGVALLPAEPTTTPAPEPPDTPKTPTASPDQQPVTDGPASVLTPRLLLDSDLGTGSSEFSAVALNEDTNRLLIADDEGLIFEFDLDDGGLPITPLRRTISVRVGAGDIEGLAWLNDETYAIAHEDDGAVTVVDFDDQVSEITDEHLVRTIDSGIREENGNGLEGVGFVSAGTVTGYTGEFEFVVVDERPPTVVTIDPEGQIGNESVLNIGVSDLSDVFVSPDGTLFVVSDEARVVVELTNVGDRWVAANIIDLGFEAGRFEQPEGLVRTRDGRRFYVVGEAPGPGQFSFGFWSSD